jgi:cytochrome P450
MLRQFGEQLNRPDGTMTAEQLLDRMSEYLHPYVVERLAHPGEDLFSRILAAPVGDRRWTENEAMRMCRNLLLGGLDTVAAMFGFVMHHLARHAAHRALLHDQPDLVPQAADEFLRRFGSVLLGRVAIEDFRVGAVAVKAGDVVLLPTALHNLDARSFDAPLAVDFQRGMVAHSTMGNGAHRCVGAGLARLELVTFLEEWLDAIPEFTIDPARPVRMRGGGVGSLQALPLVWPAGYQGN